jgi:hypothetical protein
MGEVKPQAENFVTPGDENCDGIPSSDALWAQNYADSIGSGVTGIASDRTTGDIYISGTIGQPRDFGCGTTVPVGPFLVELHPDGSCAWTKPVPVSGIVATSAAGNIGVVAETVMVTNWGGSDLAKGLVMASFSPAGNHLWSRSCGAGAHANDVSYYKEQLIVAGRTSGAYDCGSFSSGSSVGAFLAKFDANGAPVFAHAYTGGEARGVATDVVGSMWLVGNYTSTLNLGGANLTVAGVQSMFVARYGVDGLHNWSQGFGDSGAVSAASVAMDASGGPIVVGTLMGTVTVGNATLSSAAGSADVLALKLASTGASQWAKRFGDDNSQFADVVTSDSSGNFVVAGRFYGLLDFGQPMTSLGPDYPFIAKLAMVDGQLVWSRSYMQRVQSGLGLATMPDHGVALGGAYVSELDFVSIPLLVNSAEHAGGFAARFAP